MRTTYAIAKVIYSSVTGDVIPYPYRVIVIEHNAPYTGSYLTDKMHARMEDAGAELWELFQENDTERRRVYVRVIAGKRRGQIGTIPGPIANIRVAGQTKITVSFVSFDMDGGDVVDSNILALENLKEISDAEAILLGLK